MPETHRKRSRSSRGNASSGRRGLSRRSESFVSKNLIMLLGFVFILASLWFAIGSAGDLLQFFHSGGKPEVVQPGKSISSPAPATALVSPASEWLWVWGIGVALMTTFLMYLAVRWHRREIPQALVPVFYAFLGLMAVKSAWPAYLLFPLIWVFTLLLYLTGKKLAFTTANRINLLLAWLFISSWWGIHLIAEEGTGLFLQYFLFIVPLYFFFYALGIKGAVQGHRTFSRYISNLGILINIFGFFLLTALILNRLEAKEWIWLLALVAGGQVLLIPIWLKTTVPDHDLWILSGTVLLSLVLPLLYTPLFGVLLTGSMAVLFMLWSHFSENRYGLIISLLSLALMAGIYMAQWVFSYLPALFLKDAPLSGTLFIRGLLSSLFVILVIYTVQFLLVNTRVRLSKQWFRRSRYIRIMKGMLLAVAYLAGFWFVNYILMKWWQIPEGKWLSWFLCSSLFFLVIIPVLAIGRSSHLKKILWLALILTLLWPLTVHFATVDFRNDYLLHGKPSAFLFYFHYAGLLLLILLLVLLHRMFAKTFRDAPIVINGIRIFMIIMGIFLLLSEYDHLDLIVRYEHGLQIEEMIMENRALPYSVILLLFSSGLMILGFFRRDGRFFRMAGVGLLTITLVKIGYLDMKTFPAASRVAFLLGSGVFLLLFSYLYPRLSHRHRHHHSSHHTRSAEKNTSGNPSGTNP
ncbi:MAG TPA: DUF2339 domain-containing protein [Bacteroidales bacterium]|nr:DUF2339 domain-containing protein [Bacteroidales bacterium]HPT09248.1 DUF2339 domain-containing protein [Bacteroidales bacterium]